MQKAFIYLVGILLFTLSLNVFGEGTNEGSFARDGVGARALAMGGAFVATANDTSAGFWNPAGISYLDGYHLGGMYIIGGRYGDPDITFQDLSLSAKPVQTGSFSGLGLGITWVNHHIAGIPYTGDGGGGTFDDDQSLFLFSASFPFEWAGGLSTSLGVNLKYYRHSLLDGRGSGLGFDLGLLFKGTLKEIPLSLGVVSMDTLETIVRWQGTMHNPDNYVPWIVKVGTAVLLLEGKLLLAGDIDFSPSPLHSDFPRYAYLDRLHLGVEVSPVAQLALRGGIIVWRDGTKRLSAGLGITPLEGLAIDYAYVKGSESGLGGDTHILSAEFKISVSGE